ncbi:Uncharacterized protein TCM_013831 [Theobroma cacao]|uniref:SHSP domain-containing protein n=1 Tax=Theobroma cacao TaxID=3641 RepID=A0A061FWV4_THECC|nr:Uncharacterized protein TCM_013831 [Theobroma cacao]
MDDVYGTRASEEFVPHWNWTEDSMGHYLSVHLPGFRKEEMMVGLAYPGYVTISGERTADDDKCIYFGQAMRLPENLDMNKIGQKFGGEMLCLTFPKRAEEKDNGIANPAAQELSNDENQRKHDEGHGHDANEEKSKQTDHHDRSFQREMRKKGSILERAIDLFKNNISLTIVLAFSLGLFVSRRFESNGE